MSGLGGRRSLLPYLLATVLLCAVKLWLVHPDEVVAVHGNFDQLRYAEMADHMWEGRWLGPYDQRTLIRGPAFPAFMVLARSFGLPLRLASELALLVAAALFGLVALRAGARWPGAVMAAVFLVLSPLSYPINSEVLSEVLYTPLLILAVATGALALLATGVRAHALATTGLASCLAVLWHTRPEHGLVVAFVATLVLIELAGARRGPRRARWTRGGLAAALPALVIALATAAIGLTNRAVYGVFIDNELLSGGFRAAHDALLRIDAPPRKFVAVPESSRRQAYAVSPSFSRLEPFVEGTLKAPLAAAGCVQFEVCDDIVNGWFLFAVRDAAFFAGVRDAPAAEAFYRAVARDIDEACDTGRLSCRSRFALPYVSAARAPHLPRSLREMLLWITYPAGSATPMSDPPEIDPVVRAVFDRTALRRGTLVAPGTFEVSGWAFGEGGVAVQGVSLEDAAGTLLGHSPELTVRPDVVAYFQERGVVAPERTGFRVAGLLPPGGARLPDARFLFALADGRAVAGLLDPSGAAPDGVRRGIEVRRETPRPPERVRPIRAAIERTYNAAMRLALWWALGVSAWRALRRDDAALPRPLAGLVMLSLAVGGARLLYFTLVNVFLFGAAPRYLYPIVGLCGAALVLAIAGARRAGDTPVSASPAGPTGEG